MEKEKHKKAAALKYDNLQDSAPKVTAKGSGKVAKRIIELAKNAGIPIQNDPDLLEALMFLDFEEEIPPELYRAVAEILAFTYRMNRQMMEDGS